LTPWWNALSAIWYYTGTVRRELTKSIIAGRKTPYIK
jgi:hypothetical protein